MGGGIACAAKAILPENKRSNCYYNQSMHAVLLLLSNLIWPQQKCRLPKIKSDASFSFACRLVLAFG